MSDTVSCKNCRRPIDQEPESGLWLHLRTGSERCTEAVAEPDESRPLDSLAKTINTFSPSGKAPCGTVLDDGHWDYVATCAACSEANSDAPEWTL